jgi:hypothetical protein
MIESIEYIAREGGISGEPEDLRKIKSLGTLREIYMILNEVDPYESGYDYEGCRTHHFDAYQIHKIVY